MPVSLRTSPGAAVYFKLMQRYLVPRLSTWGLTPNRLSWLGMLVSVAVPVGFWIHPLGGLLLILLSGVADSLDGLMARQQNGPSLWGAFLDSCLDRVSDFFYLAGFWVMLSRHAGHVPAALAIFICTLLTILISYIKARAEALGCSCRVGLMERGTRTAFLIVWALALVLVPDRRAVVLWLGIGLYGLLTSLTVLQRWVCVAHQMADRQPPEKP
jgi:phosphatidylinositol phosphate synthase